ncbi:hypothetical protein C8R46DRAFT_1041018 [Mycena filopes]|nr:hypothetical protein C8R46DRAFT_1041018 [Mycena filopes]
MWREDSPRASTFYGALQRSIGSIRCYRVMGDLPLRPALYVTKSEPGNASRAICWGQPEPIIGDWNLATAKRTKEGWRRNGASQKVEHDGFSGGSLRAARISAGDAWFMLSFLVDEIWNFESASSAWASPGLEFRPTILGDLLSLSSKLSECSRPTLVDSHLKLPRTSSLSVSGRRRVSSLGRPVQLSGLINSKYAVHTLRLLAAYPDSGFCLFYDPNYLTPRRRRSTFVLPSRRVHPRSKRASIDPNAQYTRPDSNGR